MSGDDLEFVPLLQDLIDAYGPPGYEAEIRTVTRDALTRICPSVEEDRAGNLIATLRAPHRDPETLPLALVVHLDEIGMMVQRINDDGTIKVAKLGGVRPMSFGQVPVDILAASGPLRGVLSLGSLHAPSEKVQITREETDFPGWDDLYIVTGHDRGRLAEKGVRPGTRIVVAKEMRRLQHVGNLIAGPFMDDRAPLCGSILALRRLAERADDLKRDVHLVCSVSEETTNRGALFAASRLGDCEVVALEVGPVLPEYNTHLSPQPIVPLSDMKGQYSLRLSERIREVAADIGVEVQMALFENYGSDASELLAHGRAPTGAALCMPTENTHGFEIIHEEAIPVYSRVIEELAVNL